MEAVKELNRIIANAKSIVFLGGAGVSTESGIPDFRSANGLYALKFDYPPEQMLSHTFFMTHTAEFFEFYRAYLLPPQNIAPNAAHYKLAELEQLGKLSAVVTQNIDGLHQAAGSKKVLELHGSVLRNFCMKCGKAGIVEKGQTGVPRCSCGGIIKPDVVLYEEPLDSGVLEQAVECISRADVLIIGGTSLNVYPAAGLARYFKGQSLVIINKSPTPYDGTANLLINDSIGKVLGAVEV
jgi:NAD-dependent deacetylase